MIEQLIPVGKAARQLGVDPKTLRSYLTEFCGLEFPQLGRRRSPLVPVRDVENVVRRLRAKKVAASR